MTPKQLLDDVKVDPAIRALSPHERAGAEKYLNMYSELAHKYGRTPKWILRRQVWNELDIRATLSTTQTKGAKVASKVLATYSRRRRR